MSVVAVNARLRGMVCAVPIVLATIGDPTTTISTPMPTQRTTLSVIYKSSAYPVTVTRHQHKMFRQFQRAVEYVRKRWVLHRLAGGDKR